MPVERAHTAVRSIWARLASASLRTVGTVAAVGTVGTGSAVLTVGVYAANTIHAPRRRGYTDSMVLTPEDLNRPYEEVQFFAADGVSLTGWHIPQSSQGKSSRRTIVCCHPYNHSKSNLLGVAAGFWKQGYSLFLFDFRSFAHNPTPQSIGFYEQRDARAAIEVAKRISPPDAKIGLMGASMGAAVSLIVGHEEAPGAVGICADCPFMSLRDVLEQAVHHQYPLLPVRFVPIWIGGFVTATLKMQAVA
jgi:alpha-beta hydrolase superfamily lysophospholipase